MRGQQAEWRDGRYYEHTYAQLPQHAVPKCESVRTERWKYVRYTDFNPPREQLFDLAAETLVRLRVRCDEYRETLER